MDADTVVALLEYVWLIMLPVVLLCIAAVVLLVVIPIAVERLRAWCGASWDQIIDAHADGVQMIADLIRRASVPIIAVIAALITARPTSHYVEQLHQTVSRRRPDGDQTAPSGRSEAPPSAQRDITSLLRARRGREVLIEVLVAAGWSTEDIRTAVKGDTTVLTQEIAACKQRMQAHAAPACADAQPMSAREQYAHLLMQQRMQQQRMGAGSSQPEDNND